jgi:tetratricopeptide (TPR) repeat protein
MCKKILNFAKNKFVIGVCVGIFVTTIYFYGVHFQKETYQVLMDFHVPESVPAFLYKNNPEILYLLGNRHLGGEGTYNLEKAESYYNKAIELDEKFRFAHYQRARVYFLTMRYRMAIDEVNKEILYNPDFSRSYYLRGLVYGYDKKFPEAASDFTEFISREPDEWAGYNDLAWVLFQMGDYAGVKEAMEIILVQSRNAWLLNAYGVALLNLEENEKALEIFIEAKDLASRMTPELWGVAYIGNDPGIYPIGLEEMKRNIDENIEIVNNRLSKS